MKNQNGFTIIELMSVILISSIIFTFGVPSLKNMVDNSKMRTASQDLFSSFMLARSQAIIQNTEVSITAISGDWANGWIVTNGDAVTRIHDPLPSSVTITGPLSATYTIDGRVTSHNVSVIQMSINESTASKRCIYFSSSTSTRVLVDKDRDSDCLNG